MAINKRIGLVLLSSVVVSTCILPSENLSAYAGPNQAQAISLNNEGVKALQAANYQLAIQKFEAALQLEPTYRLAKENLAIAYNNYGLALQHNPQEAIKQFHQAAYLDRTNTTTMQNLAGIITLLQLDPHNFSDRIQLGDTARKSSDFIGAVVEYSEALKLKNDPTVHAKLADVYLVLHELDKAIAEYQAAISSADDADLEVRLGQAYQAKNDIPNAIAAYGKALQLNPNNTDVLEALKAGWESALKADPMAAANHIGYGQALQYSGDFDQAAAEYKMALSLDRGNPTARKLLDALPAAKKQATVGAHVDKGVDYQGKKLYDQAIQEYQLALAADPNNDTIMTNIGSAYQQSNRFNDAMTWYNRALHLNPSNGTAKTGLDASQNGMKDQQIAQTNANATTAFKNRDYATAENLYQQLISMNPKDAASHFDLGAAYQAEGRIDDAIAEYNLAINIDPTNADYTKSRSTAFDVKAQPLIDQAVKLHAQKQYAQAIDLYQQALKYTPNNASLIYDLAGAQYANQDYDGAKQSYQAALKVDPKGQVNDIYSIGLIDENAGMGALALGDYRDYLAQAPNGTYATQAKERMQALSNNISATIKIKTEAELAQIKTAQDAFQNALSLQKQNRYDEAITQYQNAVQAQPQEPDYVYGLGTAYAAKGDYANAITQYNKAISMDASNKDYQKALADAMDSESAPIIDAAVKKQTGGDIAGAIQGYLDALKLVPNNADVWTNLATAYQNSDNFQQARDAYTKALYIDPKGQAGNWYFVGTIDENSNLGLDALGDYQKYVAAQPTGSYAAAARDRIKALSANPQAVDKLQTQAELAATKAAQDAFDQGVKLQEAGRYDDAIAQYQKAQQAVPKEPSYAYALGTAYQSKNDLNNAISWYEQAINLAPQNADYKKVLNDAYETKAGPLMDSAIKKQQAGDLPGAIADYQQALAIVPNDAHCYTNLGSAYQATEDWNSARVQYMKAYQIDPKGEVDNLYFTGVLDETLSQGTTALQDYRDYVAKAPRGAYAAAAQDRIKVLAANPNNVQKMVTQAQQKVDTDAANAYQEGIKLQQDNKLDDAIAQYQKALTAVPNEPSYWYALGTAYQAKNDLDNALNAYNKAISINPGEKSFKDALAQVKQLKAAPLLDSAFKKQTTKDAAGNFDLAGAIADYESALKLSDDASTHLNLGTAYQANNNIPKALSEYNRALQLDSKQYDAYYYLGTVHETLKQPAQALVEYRKYIANQPNGPNAADSRARIKALGGR